MKKLIVSAFVEKGKIQLILDGDLLPSVFPVEMELDDEEHLLQWFVNSPTGGQFTLSISSPKSAEMQLTKRLGKGEKYWGCVEV
ncbi:hypothetical protein MMU07_12600 [Aquiflexum sp. LQ15W]|uniref:hypothetical protein n=1 Tax=Cognataquiflexum nitidum TaxID=2922272 RepID=UPI001F13032C|nr:hypothetical protein [Cognataquiflexum nitidum]MCH6200422.1 hypothetical protein [Cognataquiflexum nitidum]